MLGQPHPHTQITTKATVKAWWKPALLGAAQFAGGMWNLGTAYFVAYPLFQNEWTQGYGTYNHTRVLTSDPMYWVGYPSAPFGIVTATAGAGTLFYKSAKNIQSAIEIYRHGASKAELDLDLTQLEQLESILVHPLDAPPTNTQDFDVHHEALSAPGEFNTLMAYGCAQRAKECVIPPSGIFNNSERSKKHVASRGHVLR